MASQVAHLLLAGALLALPCVSSTLVELHDASVDAAAGSGLQDPEFSRVPRSDHDPPHPAPWPAWVPRWAPDDQGSTTIGRDTEGIKLVGMQLPQGISRSHEAATHSASRPREHLVPDLRRIPSEEAGQPHDAPEDTFSSGWTPEEARLIDLESTTGKSKFSRKRGDDTNPPMPDYIEGVTSSPDYSLALEGLMEASVMSKRPFNIMPSDAAYQLARRSRRSSGAPAELGSVDTSHFSGLELMRDIIRQRRSSSPDRQQAPAGEPTVPQEHPLNPPENTLSQDEIDLMKQLDPEPTTRQKRKSRRKKNKTTTPMPDEEVYETSTLSPDEEQKLLANLFFGSTGDPSSNAESQAKGIVTEPKEESLNPMPAELEEELFSVPVTKVKEVPAPEEVTRGPQELPDQMPVPTVIPSFVNFPSGISPEPRTWALTTRQESVARTIDESDVEEHTTRSTTTTADVDAKDPHAVDNASSVPNRLHVIVPSLSPPPPQERRTLPTDGRQLPANLPYPQHLQYPPYPQYLLYPQYPPYPQYLQHLQYPPYPYQYGPGISIHIHSAQPIPNVQPMAATYPDTLPPTPSVSIPQASRSPAPPPSWSTQLSQPVASQSQQVQGGGHQAPLLVSIQIFAPSAVALRNDSNTGH